MQNEEKNGSVCLSLEVAKECFGRLIAYRFYWWPLWSCQRKLKMTFPVMFSKKIFLLWQNSFISAHVHEQKLFRRISHTGTDFVRSRIFWIENKDMTAIRIISWLTTSFTNTRLSPFLSCPWTKQNTHKPLSIWVICSAPSLAQKNTLTHLPWQNSARLLADLWSNFSTPTQGQHHQCLSQIMVLLEKVRSYAPFRLRRYRLHSHDVKWGSGSGQQSGKSHV
jgi:hypothetical protein